MVKIIYLVLSIILMMPGAVLASDELKFSWDTVPLYAHFGARRGMTDVEVRFIASHYDFITLEKFHGANPHGGVSEPGTFADTARIKAINPDAKVLFYWNLLLDYPAYEASKTRVNDKDWFLKTLDGKLHYKRGTLKRYDLSNADWRKWWVGVAKKSLAAGKMDGLFIDAIPQISLQPKERIREWGAEKYTAVERGIGQTLNDLQQALGPDKITIYNGIRSVPGGWSHGGTKYLNNASGIITEHFNMFNSTGPTQIAADLARMSTAAKAGKIVIFKAWPGFSWLDKPAMKLPLAALKQRARDNISFPLAAFLIVAQEQSYFNYTWGYRETHGAFDWYPEFDKPLGQPLNDATQSGYEYRRNFKRASVYLNIKDKTAKITWR